MKSPMRTTSPQRSDRRHFGWSDVDLGIARGRSITDDCSALVRLEAERSAPIVYLIRPECLVTFVSNLHFPEVSQTPLRRNVILSRYLNRASNHSDLYCHRRLQTVQERMIAALWSSHTIEIHRLNSSDKTQNHESIVHDSLLPIPPKHP
jgi:hypothetical protein